MKKLSKWMKVVLSLVLAVALVIPTTAYAAEEKHIEIGDEEVYLYVGDQRPFDCQILPEGLVPEPDDMNFTWKSGDENVLEHMHDNFFKAVAAGTTTVTVTTKSGLTDTIPVTVMAPLKWNGEKTETIIFNSRFRYRMFELTVPEDGLYQFSADAVEDYLTVMGLVEGNDYNNSVFQTAFSEGADVQANLEADKTYTLVVGTIGGTYSYDLTLSKVSEKEVELFTQDSATISVGDTLSLSHFVQTTEPVIFTSQNTEVVSIYPPYLESGEVWMDGMEVGSTVLTATTESGRTDTMEVTIKETEVFDMDSTKKFTLGNGYLKKCFELTVEENDDRILRSNTNIEDTFAEILDANYGYVTDNDDYIGHGLNFGFDFTDLALPAGTYYLRVMELGTASGENRNTGAFEVEIAQGDAVAADSIELLAEVDDYSFMEGDTLYVAKGSNLYFDVSFGSTILAESEGWDLTSNNTNVVDHNDNDGMWIAKNVGTATVTVESENGLTDSVKICVVDKFIAGDLNRDGVIGSADINLILGVINGTVEMKDIYYQAEVNGDNKIDVNDIAALVTSAELIKNPTKTTYTVGEAFDTTGMELKVTFVDGNVETVTDGFIVSGYDAAKEGTQKVTISYGNETFPFEVTVVKASPATGDATTYAWAIVMVLCAGYAVLTLKKRRNS